MSKLMDSIFAKAKVFNKRIVLAEGEEPRIIKAAVEIVASKLAHITLVGNIDKIKLVVPDVNLDGIDVIDPSLYKDTQKFASMLYEMRKSKGMTEDQAAKLVLNNLYFGVMLVHTGACDGMVAGAINSTGDVLRPALQIIKTAPGISTVSSYFVMNVDQKYGENGVMIFGDCAVNVNPTAEQLAAIAISSARSAATVVNITPKVAMLSFSTKGSAKHELVDKVVEATNIVHKLAPDIHCDGELQADAALVESVGKLKSPDSTVAGHANVLIFPDLASGNIAYKLVQRLAGAEAVGPICQGFNKPVNDLSRGCSVEDVIGVVAITAVQASAVRLT